MKKVNPIIIQPIGIVKNSIRKPLKNGWENISSRIILDPQYEEGLEGIEAYSHIFILFWIDRLDANMKGIKKVHPKSRKDLPLVGVFATRTQYRPNPIGLTLVQMLGRKKNIIWVKGLDALDGTPIIDLKPISPRTEFPRQTRVPPWYRRLWEKPFDATKQK